MSEKILCECGYTVMLKSLSAHKKSVTHMTIMNVDEDLIQMQVKQDKRKEKILCGCGHTVSRSHLSEHKKTAIPSVCVFCP
jgi:CDGSH-type Zn-finger protein